MPVLSSDFPSYNGPENWKDDQTMVRITIEADREDITWISGRIYEEVDIGRGGVNTSTVTKGKHSLVFDTTIAAALLTPFITKGLDLLVSDIQKRIKQNRKKIIINIDTEAVTRRCAVDSRYQRKTGYR